MDLLVYKLELIKMKLLEIRNLSKVFYKKDKSETVVLSNINFSVKKGESFVIIGPNGKIWGKKCFKSLELN